MTDDKARENRARRKAARQGLLLRKSAVRDPDAPTYGIWYLDRITVHGNPRQIVSGTLDAIELHLDSEYQNGRNDGAKWARGYATADEMELFAEFEHGQIRRGEGLDSILDYFSAKNGEQVLAMTIDDEHDTYWRGFAAGATS